MLVSKVMNTDHASMLLNVIYFCFIILSRGRHASKVTEEEEDEECLKEEEDGLSGNTRLVTQPSCKGPRTCIFSHVLTRTCISLSNC